MIRVLNTKDAVLDKENLKKYLAKFASDNVVKNKSDKDTYPIPRVKENLKYISLVYTLLNEHIKIGIPVHPAGEWILDNFYVIEKSAKTVQKELSKSKYVSLPGLSSSLDVNGARKVSNINSTGLSGFARIFVLANEIISNTDGKLSQYELKEYLESYQTQKNLTMEEIWSVGIFLQIAIIEKIRHICEKIFVAQTQKFKVENMIERIIENKPRKTINMNTNGAYPFIEYMSYRLKRYGKDGIPYLAAFEEQVNKMGLTLSEVISREHFDIAVRKLSIMNAINSIREISKMNITTIFRQINEVEKILNEDPAKVYPNMDYSSKDYYRNKVLEISKKTKMSEIFVAKQALELCKNNEDDNVQERETDKESKKDYNSEIAMLKKSHIGYYLIDEGYSELMHEIVGNHTKIKLQENSKNKAKAQFDNIAKGSKKNSDNKKVNEMLSSDTKAKIYVMAIYIVTIIITALLFMPLKFCAILLFIPIQNAVTQIIQYILLKNNKPKHIPKIELKGRYSTRVCYYVCGSNVTKIR